MALTLLIAMMKKTLFCFFPALVLSTALSHAATVYQNGVFNSTANALPSDPSNSALGTWQASKFTILSAPGTTGITINSITVEGIFLGGSAPATDSFSVAIMYDGGTIPGAVLASFSNVDTTRTAPGTAFGAPRYQFTLDPITDIELPVGTYWLSVANDTPGNSSSQSWYWTTSGENDTGNLRAESSTSQTAGYTFNSDARFVYSFEGTTVPEPSTLLLGSLGMLGILALRKKA